MRRWHEINKLTVSHMSCVCVCVCGSGWRAQLFEVHVPRTASRKRVSKGFDLSAVTVSCE